METYCNKVNIRITQRDDFIQTAVVFLMTVTGYVLYYAVHIW